jgi:hypothetical protein
MELHTCVEHTDPATAQLLNSQSGEHVDLRPHEMDPLWFAVRCRYPRDAMVRSLLTGAPTFTEVNDFLTGHDFPLFSRRIHHYTARQTTE